MNTCDETGTQDAKQKPVARSIETNATPGLSRAIDVLNLICSAVIAVTAIVGTVYVMLNLGQLKVQNAQLNRSLKESYRPVGTICQPITEEGYPQIRLRAQEDDGHRDSWNLTYQPMLVNRGHGLLTYIGHVYVVVKDSMDFRARFLAGSTDTVAFDGRSGYARGFPLAPSDSMRVTFVWKHIPISTRFFLYGLIFYKDQDGDLFDTEHLMSAVVVDTSEAESNPKLVIQSAPGARDSYHRYRADERKILRRRLIDLRHDLALHI